jgi:hypothetical protein
MGALASVRGKPSTAGSLSRKAGIPHWSNARRQSCSLSLVECFFMAGAFLSTQPPLSRSCQLPRLFPLNATAPAIVPHVVLSEFHVPVGESSALLCGVRGYPKAILPPIQSESISARGDGRQATGDGRQARGEMREALGGKRWSEIAPRT